MVYAENRNYHDLLIFLVEGQASGQTSVGTSHYVGS